MHYWIHFEMWDFDNGFYVDLEVKYSIDNLAAILCLKGARNIRLV